MGFPFPQLLQLGSMPKLKYLWMTGTGDMSSQERATWVQKCPNVVFNGDKNCSSHHIASPYEFGGCFAGQIWEVPCKGMAFADPADEEDWDDSDDSGPYWPYPFPPPSQGA